MRDLKQTAVRRRKGRSLPDIADFKYMSHKIPHEPSDYRAKRKRKVFTNAATPFYRQS